VFPTLGVIEIRSLMVERCLLRPTRWVFGTERSRNTDAIACRLRNTQPVGEQMKYLVYAGDACPNCDGGKVCVQTTPARLVRLLGQAPVSGTVYELQRLRCHLCDAVFTAEPPEGIGDQKYDATVVSMMANLRYGQGMPGNRLASLQQSVGIPLPAST
jgi:hypothetical protein